MKAWTGVSGGADVIELINGSAMVRESRQRSQDEELTWRARTGVWVASD